MVRQEHVMTASEVRSAAVLAAATFCAPCEGSTAIDVINIAEALEEYILHGKAPTTSPWL